MAEYDNEEIEAGVHQINAWGFLNVLPDLTGGIWSEREKVLNSSVSVVFTEIQRRSHVQAYQRRLRKEYESTREMRHKK